ncbi:MAG: cation diffusion facilitator family transporter [Crocinitomicaceae bacterium]|nr:cation diffusion facilitator family transporter [Crocinitomicaceae bacterium]
MGHNHGHVESAETKNLRLAFFLNFFFTIIEIIGGFFTNSVAILSDAIHDLGDTFSLGLAWYLQKVSQKERDEHFSYGYKRYSVLGALINVTILLVGSVFILWETISRLLDPQEVHPEGMIALALLGILVNGVAALRLKKGSSMNERVVALHLLEDVLGWVAVFIGAIIMLFWDVPILDPILSILITGYILFGVFKNLKKVLEVILQRIPSNVVLADIENYLSSKDGIKGYSDIHIWSLDGNFNIMTVNIQTNEELSIDQMAKIKQDIHEDLISMNVQHCTIELVF